MSASNKTSAAFNINNSNDGNGNFCCHYIPSSVGGNISLTALLSQQYYYTCENVYHHTMLYETTASSISDSIS